jgi:AcrR family transcriptional regulator
VDLQADQNDVLYWTRVHNHAQGCENEEPQGSQRTFPDRRAHVVQKGKMMTNSKSVDRRTLRTRRALRDGLLSILVERSWDELSVQDICDRADIGRSTFYLHFPSKEELLRGSFDDLRGALNALTDEDQKTTSTRPLAFVHGLLEHLHEQRQLCRSIFGRRSAHTVQVRFREMVTKLVANNLAPLAPAGWTRDAAVHYLAGALVKMLAWWIDSRPMRSVNEIEQLYLRLAEPAIKELLRR